MFSFVTHALMNHNEHAHPDRPEEWQALLTQVSDIVQLVIVMALVGLFFFRLYLWTAIKQPTEHPWVIRLERIAAITALYVFMFTSPDTGLSILRIALCVVWLLLTYEWLERILLQRILKTGMAIALLSTLVPVGQAPAGSSDTMYGLAPALYSFFVGIHMAAVVIWVGGGVGLFIVFKQPLELASKQLHQLVLRFSAFAQGSLLALVFSGLLLTLHRLDSWGDLFYSLEGQFIIIKSLIALAICWTAALQYKRWTRTYEHTLGHSLVKAGERVHYQQGIRFTISLLIVSLLFSSLLSALGPNASSTSEPFYWHVMGVDAHMSLRINPTTSTEQNIRLDVWLPSEKGLPDEVRLNMIQAGRSLPVPLALDEGGPDPYGFEGFSKYSYVAEGPYMRVPGDWTFQVLVKDKDGRAFPYEKTEFINF